MPTLRAAALGLAAILALSACSDDGPAAGDPMSTWTPSGTIEKPSETATEKPTEPALPDAATKATEAGARAFITYYWDLINYAQLTGDVRGLSKVSGQTCAGCNRVMTAISDLYEGGGSATGGEYAIAVDRAKEVATPDKSAFGMEVAITVRNREQTIVEGSGESTVSAPATNRYLTYLIWTGRAWRNDIMEPR